MSAQPPVTAVVCARNRARVIDRCLRSVQAGGAAEILVIDGESDDATADIARQFNVRVVSDSGRGLGAARQLGAELASHPYLMYVDADTVLASGAIEALYEEAERQRYDAVQARLFSQSDAPTYWQRAELWRRRVQERPGPAHVIGCQATLMRRELVRSVQFDEVFTGAAEDHDFCFRARAAGAILAHSRVAAAYHDDRPGIRDLAGQRFWYGRGMTRLLIRHGSVADQMRSAAGAMRRTPRYVPFLFTSWAFTALGMAWEAIAMLRRPALRSALRERRGLAGPR